MTEILRFIFEYLTEPLGLPIAWWQEYLIMFAVGEIAFRLAYAKVGDLYDFGYIHTRIAGKILHWSIRLAIYFAVWAVMRGAIWLYRFMLANWITVLSIAIGTLLLAWIVKRTIFFMKFYKSLDGDKNA